MKHVYIIVVCFVWTSVVFAATTVSVLPETILQGDPILVTVTGSSSLKGIIFGTEHVPVFTYEGKSRALIGIDLSRQPGTYGLNIRFADGKVVKKTITVVGRQRIELPLGIPEKLGGNTPTSQKNLVDSLARENEGLRLIRTGTKAFWTKPFRSPLLGLTVTDPYGYNRKTGVYTIAHKGTDFRAAEGTKVFAMNRGVIRIARAYRTYGKTIIVDHGLGLQTLSMHLSRINVNEGELVLPGQVIGLSGQTGYAEKPHLHVSIRINGISIDPIKFLSLFNLNP